MDYFTGCIIAFDEVVMKWREMDEEVSQLQIEIVLTLCRLQFEKQEPIDFIPSPTINVISTIIKPSDSCPECIPDNPNLAAEMNIVKLLEPANLQVS